MKISLPKMHYHIIFLSILVGLQGCGGKSNNATTEALLTTAQTTPVILSDSTEGNSIRSTKHSATIPHTLKTGADNQQTTLTWSAVSNASNYTVYWSNTLPFEQQNAVAEQTNTASFTHHVTPNTTYYYQVSSWVNGEEHPLLGTITTQFKHKKSTNQSIVDNSF
jgi:hypothetical protein